MLSSHSNPTNFWNHCEAFREPYGHEGQASTIARPSVHHLTMAWEDRYQLVIVLTVVCFALCLMEGRNDTAESIR